MRKFSHRRRPCWRSSARFQFEPLESRVVMDAASLADSLNVGEPAARVEASLAGPAAALDAGESTLAISVGDHTAEFLQAEHDRIPNYVHAPTIRSVRNGDWLAPGTWSAGRVPQEGDVVLISPGHFILYTQPSDVKLKAVGIAAGAMLRMSPWTHTRLTVGTLIVFEGGYLQVGTETNPVQPKYQAEIVFTDTPIDLDYDPKQYGQGLIAFGKVDIVGAAKSRTWLRLARAPRAGDTVLYLEEPVTGWRKGDELVLPDTRQSPPTEVGQFDLGFTSDFASQLEVVKFGRFKDGRAELMSPIAFDHPAALGLAGEEMMMPHVGVLTRNVILRSENPNGTRGHVLIGERAQANIQNARFTQLGRTDAFADLDNTQVDEHGEVLHVGTNQIGRYTFHLHHVDGLLNSPFGNYQFKVIGNTFDAGRRWGVAIHDSSYGLVRDNVAFDFQGAAFVTEDGSEIYNEISRNFAVKILGTFQERPGGELTGDMARGGIGFWSRRAGNDFRDNVVANASFAGFAFNSRLLGRVRLPAFRGADKEQPGQGIYVLVSPPGVVDGFEIYGRGKNGLWIQYPVGSVRPRVPLAVRNTRIWHVYGNAVEMYHTNGVSFENVTILGDATLLPGAAWNYLPVGLNLTGGYENYNTVIRNSWIGGMAIGVRAPEVDAGGEGGGAGQYIPDSIPTILRDSVLANHINVNVVSSRYLPAHLVGKGISIYNVAFTDAGLGSIAGVPGPFNIRMELDTPARSRHNKNIFAKDVVRVYDYNGVPGDNFQVYYLEQAPSFVPPSFSDPTFIGSPIPGATNQQLWSLLGVAIGGAVATCAQQRPGILGFVCPLAATSQGAAALVTPVATPTAEPRTASSTGQIASQRMRIAPVSSSLAPSTIAKRPDAVVLNPVTIDAQAVDTALTALRGRRAELDNELLSDLSTAVWR